ncbi:MAG: chemotaxis protein CheW [Rhodospirillales bacterium]
MQQNTNAAVDEMPDGESLQQILTTTVGNQTFGIPVLCAQDILRPRPIARVQQAEAYVSGLINLRGRIVTVIDLRHWLGFESADANEQMHVVMEFEGDLYSFLVDSVGDVVKVPTAAVEAVPPNLPAQWRMVIKNVLRHDGELILIIEGDALLTELSNN